MIERKFIEENMKELLVRAYLSEEMGTGKYSGIDIKKTPLGEKIIVYTSKPGLVVGKKGENIKKLTIGLKNKFQMENPQIEVSEIMSPNLNAQNVAEQIVNTLERFGPKRFKATGYKSLQRIMDAGAMGAEILISGRGVPSSRARSWRFYAGYLKKSGQTSVDDVKKGQSIANLRSGSIGIKVKIMLPGTKLPDKIEIKKPEITQEIKVEEVEDEDSSEKEVKDKKETKVEEKPKKTEKVEDKKETKVKEKPKETEKVEDKEETKVEEKPKETEKVEDKEETKVEEKPKETEKVEDKEASEKKVDENQKIE